MSVIPPRPPKDYRIKDVSGKQISSSVFTPIWLPRVTQTSLGKFCSPIQYDEEDAPGELHIEKINSKVLDKWAKDARATWVDQPEKNGHFIQAMVKKYSVVVDPDYDARYKHRPKVFQRSFKYEIDYAEEVRLQKLRKKCEREQRDEMEGSQRAKQREKISNENLNFELVLCKFPPPIWWPKQNDTSCESTRVHKITTEDAERTYDTPYLRWQKEPDLFDRSEKDPCKRRDEVAVCGQFFKNEAINWYYKMYPPPNIKFRPEKFI